MTQQQLQQAVQYLYPMAILGQAWTLQTDATGVAIIGYWSAGLGTVPTAAQLTAALSASQLQQAKIAQVKVITAAYTNARDNTPVSLTVGSNTYQFRTDADSQNTMTGYLAVFAGMTTKPASVPLADAAGVGRLLAPADLQTLAEAAMEQMSAAWTKFQTLQAAVAAATTTAEVMAVVWE